MKKQTLSLLTLLFGFCILLFACRRELKDIVNPEGHVSNTLLESAKIYNSRIVANSARFNSKEKDFILLKPQWDDSWCVDLGNNKKLIVAPTVENTISNRSVFVRRLFIFESSGTTVKNGQIVEFIGINDPVTPKLENLVKQFRNKFISDFTGSIIQYDLNYLWTDGNTYNQGALTHKYSTLSRSILNGGTLILTNFSIDPKKTLINTQELSKYNPKLKVFTESESLRNNGTMSDAHIDGGGGPYGGNYAGSPTAYNAPVPVVYFAPSYTPETDATFRPDDAGLLEDFYNNTYYNEMSATERIYYDSLNKAQKWQYLRNAYTALTMAQYRYPNTTWNGKGDAFRHSLFSLLNTVYLGTDIAKLMGDAHEDKPFNDPTEKIMDLYNNNKGRNAYNSSDYWLGSALGLAGSSVIIGTAVRKATDLVENGELIHIINGELVPTTFQ